MLLDIFWWGVGVVVDVIVVACCLFRVICCLLLLLLVLVVVVAFLLLPLLLLLLYLLLLVALSVFLLRCDQNKQNAKERGVSYTDAEFIPGPVRTHGRRKGHVCFLDINRPRTSHATRIATSASYPPPAVTQQTVRRDSLDCIDKSCSRSFVFETVLLCDRGSDVVPRLENNNDALQPMHLMFFCWFSFFPC